jgi:hypothetical protein
VFVGLLGLVTGVGVLDVGEGVAAVGVGEAGVFGLAVELATDERVGAGRGVTSDSCAQTGTIAIRSTENVISKFLVCLGILWRRMRS